MIEFNGERITGIREKTLYSVFVNAGIYVLSLEAVAQMDKEEFFDMPQPFDELIAAGKKTTVFPVREHWLDIGRMDNFQRAPEEYGEMFADGKDL